MTKKAWIIVAVLCVGILGGLIWLSRNNQIDVSDIDINAVQPALAINGEIADQTYGNMNAKVIIIEYGDYQCPGCSSAAPIIKEVMDKYGDKIGLIFRNYPLYTAHPNAFAASAAAEAAGLQGKFWEMHEYLYANQGAWSSLEGQARTDYFAGAAKDFGVNEQTFLSDLTGTRVKKNIEFDTALGEKAGVAGTPSFFIDGKSVGDQDVKDGKLIPSDNDSETPAVWTDANYFGTLIIEPALKAKGISLE